MNEFRSELRFALYAIKKNILSSAELRTSFLLNVVGMAINNTSFIFLWIYFVKSVGVINGWTEIDIVGLMGFTTITYGIIFSAGAGLGRIPEFVAGGGFDRFMLSPKNLLVRIATSIFSASAVGDIVFGASSLIIYIILGNMSLVQIALLLFLVVLSTFMFLAAVIAIHSASFLFSDAVNATSGIWEFFLTPTLFHGGAFQGATRFVFTFIVPSLAIASLPVELLKSMSIEKLLVLVLLSIFWFVFSLFLFKCGVKKYESTNFMTFGN